VKLTRGVQQYIEKMVQDLRGEEDFAPFIIIKDHKGDARCVMLTMPDDPNEKDTVADTMTVFCGIYRATEAAFAAVGYQSRNAKESERLLRPSEDPNRVEVVILNVVNSDNSVLHTADLIRENSLVAVSLWDAPDGRAEGRFSDALQLGIGLGQAMPPDMTKFFDEELAKGREEEMIAMFRRAFETIKKERP